MFSPWPLYDYPFATSDLYPVCRDGEACSSRFKSFLASI